MLVFIGALYTLSSAERPNNIPTDTYFGSGEDTLTVDEWNKLYGFIEDSIYPKIIQSLDKESLISIRIEGHTDKRIPHFIYGRAWNDNMVLSFHRAKEVSNILDSIFVAKIYANELTPVQKDKLKKLIMVAGFGDNKPQYEVNLMNESYYVKNVDLKINDTTNLEGPFEKRSAAIELAYKKNRRVVINIIERGI